MQSSRQTIPIILAFMGIVIWAAVASGADPVSPLDESRPPDSKAEREVITVEKAVGDPVNFADALTAGAGYVRRAQADVTEDNAENGIDGVDETPDDPDDGGWDWRLTAPDFSHSVNASPTNLYGATAQGAYQAYLQNGDPALLTVMTDAANAMIADPNVRSAADVIFLLNYNGLPGVSGTTYADAARVKYDARITAYGSATALAEYIRDVRAGQGYENGIIAWDIGAWAVAAAMLDAAYAGYGYDADADDIAEVIYQDSFVDNPGYFDIVDDAGWDPTFADTNFWWYNLGISGLIDAFVASGNHAGEIPGLVTILLDGQYTHGAISDSYGANPDNEDWQATAYAALSLARHDQSTYQANINWMAYYLAATQDAASGGWVYGSGNHYPEIGGESTAALAFGEMPTDALVDDDFTSQADVDAYNLANGTNYVFGYDAFDNVQDAVDAVSGSTVTVLAGTYVQQVHITTDNLNLVGAGVGSTIIQSPATLTAFFTTGTNDNYPVVFVDNATGVNISGLTVDGDNQGSANYRFYGVAFWNSDGSLVDAEILNVMDTTFSGAQHGVGLYCYNDTGGPYALAVTGVLVDDFQKTAVALYGTGMTIDVDDLTTIGEGPTPVTAQNGISVGYGAGGTLDDCDISDVTYTGETWTASGLLGIEAGAVTATNVDVDACQTSVYWQDTSGVYEGGTITNPLGDAFYAYSTGAKADVVPRREARPFEVSDPGKGADKAAIDVTVSNATVTGAGVTDSWGLAAWGYGPITFTVTGCTVTNWDWGVVTYDFGGATFNTTVNTSVIAGNTSYGFYSNGAATAMASCNWWGDAGGPDVPPANPNPAGDAIEGPAMYWPWWTSSSGPCDGYGDDYVAPDPVTECLTPSNTCVAVDVSFTRADVTASRGVSVTFELSDELVLCTPDLGADIIIPAVGDGSAWRFGYSNLNVQRLDNGGKSYTVDLAILGTPCGPTTGGLLFTVMVAKDPLVTTDAVGTVTVTDVLVRDCANATLPGIPGPPADINIDLTSPPALVGLAAAQRKTGNDSDGTTLIDLSWTVPGGDADTIEIWRKGFGDYPEYDDGTGTVPAPPVTAANGWTFVTSVSAAATGYPDDPDPASTNNRDFWTYAAYVTDTCGNVSAASDLTGGTLNYHLGDVHDGITAGAGDNLVSTSDISHLGFNYGITLVHNDPLNYLDVGPTTDFSVDALPTTDNQVQFEDLMMFAINYGQVSKDLPSPAAAVRNEIGLRVGPIGEIGSIFAVEILMKGDGRIQGLSVPLSWDGAVVAPVAMQPGDLLDTQGGQSLVLAPAAGTVDAALFGVPRAGISGEGLLATVSFRIVAVGDPNLGLGEISARDAENHEVEVNGELATPPPLLASYSELHAAVPNPFNPATTISFDLVRGGRVSLQIYSLSGALIRTLVNEDLARGRYEMQWHGEDNAGRRVASGAYLVRLMAPDRTQSRRITMLK